MQTSPHNAGFTLLELLVAMVIFTLIGIGAHAMLRCVLTAQEVERTHAETLTRLQKAVWIMEQDFSQAEPGSITTNGNMLVRFRRIGWRNPMGLPRSDIEQISYGTNNDKLVRYYGASPDALQAQTLLDRVSNVQMHPLAPGLIEIAFQTQEFGKIRRVIEVPQ